MDRKPVFEALPADLGELEQRWTTLLAELIAQCSSPALPDDLARGLRGDPEFMALIQGWENMPSAAQANAWNMIQDRLWSAVVASRPFCLRCGECCRRGSPVIYDQDRPSLAGGHITRADLLTLRPGETAFSNREQRLVVLSLEQVKIKEAPDGRTCIFLSPTGEACLIYDHRPFQCRIMECWDPSRFQTLLTLPPVTRLDLLGRDNPLSEIIIRHDERCRPEALKEALESIRAEAPKTFDAGLELILYDLHVREFVMEKFNLSEKEMDFFFGRPLAVLCPGFGYVLEAGTDGQPTLRRLDTTGAAG